MAEEQMVSASTHTGQNEASATKRVFLQRAAAALGVIVAASLTGAAIIQSAGKKSVLNARARATKENLRQQQIMMGKKLIINFIKTIKEMGDELWRLVLVNNGVKLTIDGSPVLEDLAAYENDGLTILVCGTCLTHFGLLEAKKIGETTNMLDIVTAMQIADKVVNI